MKQRLFSLHPTRYLLACCLITLSSCQATVLGPTMPSGYRVILPAASQTRRLQSLLLTVQVTDAAGNPVDDVPVHFRLPENGSTRATIEPPLVKTQNGRASSTFRARTAGQVSVEITVENLTQTIHISVLGETPRF
jgi:hypothetical protein